LPISFSMQKAISFSSVKKEFFLQTDRTFKDLISSFVRRQKFGQMHVALKNISFEISSGETVGIVGRNGAGKPTLLKLIAGVTDASKGKVVVNGKVAPLIEVGAGFHHELTGYENIFLNGAILGMSRKEIQRKLQEIIAFSELEEYIHVPVKRYSTGMYMRLGFSIAIHTDAPILLIDEVLAVGDAAFQKKCLDRLNQLKGERTIVFVSHDEQAVKDFCERVILLSDGKVVADDTPARAFTQYHELLKA
jgi:ABC-type polysaccharide/polyol phosphate transport system ATPase subunit